MRLSPIGTAPDSKGLSVETEQVLANIYAVAARGLSFPDRTLVEELRWDFMGLLGGLRDRSFSPHNWSALKSAARSWRAAALEDLREEYSRLYLGNALVPLRESGYGVGQRFACQPGHFADVTGFYRAFGFGPSPEAACPDHLSTELEFLSLLHLKTAMALQSGRADQIKITRGAMARFLENHLGRWIDSFEQAMELSAGSGPYRSLAHFIALIVAGDCAMLSVGRARMNCGSAGHDPAHENTVTCPPADDI